MRCVLTDVEVKAVSDSIIVIDYGDSIIMTRAIHSSYSVNCSARRSGSSQSGRRAWRIMLATYCDAIQLKETWVSIVEDDVVGMICPLLPGPRSSGSTRSERYTGHKGH